MKRSALGVIGLALGLAGLAPAWAQPPRTASAQETESRDIIVTGRRAKDIRRFVKELTPKHYGRQLGRWNHRLCTQIVGLEAQPNRAAYIKQRIDDQAAALRIVVDRAPRCIATILIQFSDNADDLAARAMKRYPELLKDVERFGLPHGKDRAPLLVPRPVRWFSIDREVGATTGGVSNILLTTEEDAAFSYAIVDTDRLGGTTWRQLADYLTVVTLARPDIAASYKGQDTILAVFEDRDGAVPPPPGLTAQDDAYLDALYLTNAALPPAAQRDQIERRIAQSLAGRADDDAPTGGH